MEDYYVLNHRLPKFPIMDYGSGTDALRRSVEQLFKSWLVEKIISNPARRRVCAHYHRFAQWLEEKGMYLEQVDGKTVTSWPPQRPGENIDFKEFLSFIRTRVPHLRWVSIKD